MRAGGALELVRFGRDPLAFLEALHRDDRDVIPLQLGTQPVLLVTRPDLIALALENDDWPPLSRGRLMAFQRWCPGGLVTTSGAEHHRQVAEIEARWHDELDRVLGDRPATSDDVGSLPYTVMVVEEALRLVPPSWAFFRALTGDYALDGHAIPAGRSSSATARTSRPWRAGPSAESGGELVVTELVRRSAVQHPRAAVAA